MAYAYEAVFCIFLVAVAFLGRENADWVYPEFLYLLLALLSLNLAAGFALRRWPSRHAMSAAVILANCAVITAILQYSGGWDSVLWVLYLLPVFTASMFLSAREVGWIAAGAVGCNLVFCVFATAQWDAVATLDVGLRSGILTLAALLTWRIADRERRAQAQIHAQRREMGELLRRAKSGEAGDASARRLAEVGLQTAGILHDLKTPLTVILGSCEIGLGERDLAGMRADFERIRSAGLLCRDIVGQVMAASGTPSAPQAPCDLGAIVDAAAEICGDLLKRNRVELAISRPRGRVPIEGSPPQLERLFLNLITNAAQAMPRGGALRIELGLAPAPAAGLPARARVVVSDTGPGLSPQMLERLFKPFSTTRSSDGGTGLGLYQCRQIAFSHRGELAAENPSEGGARFTLTLPLAA